MKHSFRAKHQDKGEPTTSQPCPKLSIVGPSPIRTKWTQMCTLYKFSPPPSSQFATLSLSLKNNFLICSLPPHEGRKEVLLQWEWWRVLTMHRHKWTHLDRPSASPSEQPFSWSSSSAWVGSSLVATTGTSSDRSVDRSTPIGISRQMTTNRSRNPSPLIR